MLPRFAAAALAAFVFPVAAPPPSSRRHVPQ